MRKTTLKTDMFYKYYLTKKYKKKLTEDQGFEKSIISIKSPTQLVYDIVHDKKILILRQIWNSYIPVSVDFELQKQIDKQNRYFRLTEASEESKL